MQLTSQSWPHAIALVDCDSFYVSCEILLDSKLKNQPVCVLSNNDGCIISRSKEAKKLGIKMGEPAFMAKKRCPNAIYLSSNYIHYMETSKKVMAILSDFTPDMEIYSIDEAFLDLSGVKRLHKKSYLEIGSDIRQKVLAEVGIPVSVGISLSKALAKIATDIAKQTVNNEQSTFGFNPNIKSQTSSVGVYTLSGKELRKVLPTVPIREVWHIGKNTEELLTKSGIKNAFELTCQNEQWVKKVLTKKGVELQAELCGHLVWKIDSEGKEIKSIQRTKSFAACTSNKEIIKGALYFHLHRALAELRIKKLKAGLLIIMLREKKFKSLHLEVAISPPSNYEFDFTNKINGLLDELFKEKESYRSCGITLNSLRHESSEQLNLFNNDSSTNLKKETLAKTWDALEKKFGKQTIRTASMPSLKSLDKGASKGIEEFSSSFGHIPEVS